jgi:hypothetical protein
MSNNRVLQDDEDVEDVEGILDAMVESYADHICDEAAQDRFHERVSHIAWDDFPRAAGEIADAYMDAIS